MITRAAEGRPRYKSSKDRGRKAGIRDRTIYMLVGWVPALTCKVYPGVTEPYFSTSLLLFMLLRLLPSMRRTPLRPQLPYMYPGYTQVKQIETLDPEPAFMIGKPIFVQNKRAFGGSRLNAPLTSSSYMPRAVSLLINCPLLPLLLLAFL